MAEDKEKISLDKQQQLIWDAWNAMQPSRPVEVMQDNWIVETYDDYIIANFGSGYFKIPYSQDGDEITFSDKSEWIEVEEKREWIAIIKALKKKHTKKSETLVTFGDAVKSLGDGKVGGYLVQFSNADEPDLEDDFFDNETDYMFELPGTSKGWFNHAQTSGIKQLSSDVDLELREFGIWAQTVLDERDKYEKFLLGLAEEGKLNWSSGTASHLVEREPAGKANHVTRWPLGLDASLTHIPAEPRNVVVPLKSLSDKFMSIPEDPIDEPETVGETVGSERSGGSTTQPIKSEIQEVITMADENEGKTVIEMTQEQLDETIAKAAEAAATKALADLPVIKEPKEKPGEVEVEVDEADKPFLSLADQCKAVKSFTLSHGRDFDVRLSRLDVKATGASEGVPSEGGFLVDPTLTGELITPIHEVGPFSSAARRLPVGSNSNYGWINGVDETNRATGSRWGGVRGYRLAEADTKTASKPKFRRIKWELKKFAVVVYGTDELLADAAQFSAVVNIACPEELNFMVNDDILNGEGATGPLGILNSGALISTGAETDQVAATIVMENLSKMWSRLDSRSKANATWYINTDCNPELDNLAYAVGTGALEARFIGFGADGVMRIKGRPVVETEFNATLGSVGDICLFNMSEYLLWEKGGIQKASSIHVQFMTDEEVFRFVYRCDGQPTIAAPLTPYKGTDTVGPFVALEERA